MSGEGDARSILFLELPSHSQFITSVQHVKLSEKNGSPGGSNAAASDLGQELC